MWVTPINLFQQRKQKLSCFLFLMCRLSQNLTSGGTNALNLSSSRVGIPENLNFQITTVTSHIYRTNLSTFKAAFHHNILSNCTIHQLEVFKWRSLLINIRGEIFHRTVLSETNINEFLLPTPVVDWSKKFKNKKICS